MANIAGHWWIILIIVLLVFGATRLPQLARGLGQSVNIFKREMKESKKESGTDSETDASTGTDSGSTSTTDQR